MPQLGPVVVPSAFSFLRKPPDNFRPYCDFKMAATEKLKRDILLKEEAFLRDVKAKLTEQLNRLKVRSGRYTGLGEVVLLVKTKHET